MNELTTERLLRVNGIQPAFGIEFGLSNPRADEGGPDDLYRQIRLHKDQVAVVEVAQEHRVKQTAL